MLRTTIIALLVSVSIIIISNGQEYDEELIQQFLAWDPPEELKRKFPYFLSGQDKEGSPVWVIELGRWDIRSTLENGSELIEDFDKYTEQMVHRWHHSPRNFSTEEHLVQKYVLIADLQGYNNAQLTHVPSVRKYLTMVRQFLETQQEFQSMKKWYNINTNPFFNTLWMTSQPLLAPFMEYIQLYNETESIWRADLLDKIDPDQLPEWLSGPSTKKWKPIRVYG